MTLQQLKYLLAVANNQFNITTAANSVFASQPALSKQLKLLEQELGLSLFTRQGKQLTGLSFAGEKVLARAEIAVRESEAIKQLAANLQQNGSLVIGTTHTQARYVLPDILQRLRQEYPGVTVDLHQGTSEQIEELLKQGTIDFAITSSSRNRASDYLTLPCFRWDRAILVPTAHPLAQLNTIELSDLVKYPLITYLFNSNGKSSLLDAFEIEGLQPSIAITARDADVIKTYVRRDMGVGIVASMAYDPESDSDLVPISAHDILPSCTTSISFREDLALADFMYRFVELLSRNLDRTTVDRSVEEFKYSHAQPDFDELKLPFRLIERLAA